MNKRKNGFRNGNRFLMGLSGLEPPTSRLSGVRSNRLSYKPICFATVLSYPTFGGTSRVFVQDFIENVRFGHRIPAGN